MKITNEEKKLLKKLANGDFDGKVGRSTYTSGGSEVWHAIKDGIPERYKEGPGGKYFDNREKVGFSGVLHSLKRWISDEDKLQFLRQCSCTVRKQATENKR